MPGYSGGGWEGVARGIQTGMQTGENIAGMALQAGQMRAQQEHMRALEGIQKGQFELQQISSQRQGEMQAIDMKAKALDLQKKVDEEKRLNVRYPVSMILNSPELQAHPETAKQLLEYAKPFIEKDPALGEESISLRNMQSIMSNIKSNVELQGVLAQKGLLDAKTNWQAANKELQDLQEKGVKTDKDKEAVAEAQQKIAKAKKLYDEQMKFVNDLDPKVREYRAQKEAALATSQALEEQRQIHREALADKNIAGREKVKAAPSGAKTGGGGRGGAAGGKKITANVSEDGYYLFNDGTKSDQKAGPKPKAAKASGWATGGGMTYDAATGKLVPNK